LRRWAQYASLSPLVHAYLEINGALKRLGKPAGAQDTPAERGSALSSLLPVVTEPAQSLVTEYQRVTYGGKPASEIPAREVGREIRRQSYLAWIRRWLARIQEPTGKNNRRR
jgi:hypothetical protein